MQVTIRFATLVAFTCLAAAAVAQDEAPTVRIPDEPTDELTVKGDASGLLLRDLNGDGFPDLILALNEGGRQACGVMFLSDKGRFEKPSWTADDPGVSSGIGVADLDGDGKEDLLLTRYNHNHASAYRGKGNGQFETSPFWQNGDTEWAYMALVGDFNGDGFNDIVAEDRIYFGAKGGPDTFYSWKMGGRRAPSGLALADMDGDGKKDLVVSNWQGPAWEVFRGVKDGFENEPYDRARQGGEICGLAVADINGDGLTDLITGASGARGGDGRVRLYSNAKGKLAAEPSWMSDDADCDVMSISLADPDGDGDLDLFVLAGSHSAVFENRKGALQTQPCWRASIPGRGFAVVDLDKDGFLDIVAGDNGKVRIYRGGAGVNPPKAEPFAPRPEFPALTRHDLAPDMDRAVESVIEAWRGASTKEDREIALAAIRPRAAEVTGALLLLHDPELDPLAREIAADAEKRLTALVDGLAGEAAGESDLAITNLVACGDFAVPALEKAAAEKTDFGATCKSVLEKVRAATAKRRAEPLEALGIRFARLTARLRKRYGLPDDLEGVVVLHVPAGLGPKIDLANIAEGDVFQGIGSLMDYGKKVDPVATPLDVLQLILKHDAEGEASNRGWRLAGYRYVCGPMHPSERGTKREGRITLTPAQWEQIKKKVADPKPWIPEK